MTAIAYNPCRAPHPTKGHEEQTKTVPVYSEETKSFKDTKVTETVHHIRCNRLAGHAGDHSAYTFSIATPETWTADDHIDLHEEVSA
jgi:hypothetical protein